MRPDEQAIRALHDTWIAAVNAGELEPLLDLMTDDVVFVNPGGEPIGRGGFRDGFLEGHRRNEIHCTSQLQEVVVVGDLAHALARDALSVAPRAGGDAFRLAGHRLTVYRRQPDGRWLLARDAHTLTPAAAD